MAIGKIISGYEPATYRYAHHMGGGQQFPAMAWARFSTTSRVEITSDQFPGLEPAALQEKAVAILRLATESRIRTRNQHAAA